MARRHATAPARGRAAGSGRRASADRSAIPAAGSCRRAWSGRAWRTSESRPRPVASSDEERGASRLLAARARVLQAGAAHAPAGRAQALDELVERALAAAITGEPDAPEDIGAREL